MNPSRVIAMSSSWGMKNSWMNGPAAAAGIVAACAVVGDVRLVFMAWSTYVIVKSP